MGKLLTGDELTKRAKELGVAIEGDLVKSAGGQLEYRNPRAPDPVLQQRVMEAERSIRESRMWLMAVISALASLASAVAAVVAVLLVRQ